MVGTDTRVTGRLVALFVAGAILTACSGGDAEPSTTTTPPTTVATTTTTSTTTTTTSTTSTTTTSEAPTTTTVDPLARPDVLVSNPNRDSIDDFDTTGDNPYLIAMELQDLFVYLEGNPPSDADEIMTLLFESDYPYWDPIRAGFLELTANPGWHYSDPGVHTLAMDLEANANDTFTVQIADERDEQVISNSDNEIVKTYAGWNRRVSEFTFHRGADGLWRYAYVSDSEPITDATLDEMVPVRWIGRI